MSSNSNGNRLVVPKAKEAMNKFKMEAANDFDVPAPYQKIRPTYIRNDLWQQ